MLTLVRVALTPLWFAAGILKSALSITGFLLPRPFAGGVFAGLAAGFGAMKWRPGYLNHGI